MVSSKLKNGEVFKKPYTPPTGALVLPSPNFSPPGAPRLGCNVFRVYARFVMERRVKFLNTSKPRFKVTFDLSKYPLFFKSAELVLLLETAKLKSDFSFPPLTLTELFIEGALLNTCLK